MEKNTTLNSAPTGVNFELHNCEQRSPEWFAARRGRVSGTALKDAMVKKALNTSAIYYRLLAEKHGDIENEETFTSKAMQRGIDLEPEARAAAGSEFLEVGFITRGEIAGVSPDGVNKEFTRAVEIKCPSAAVHMKYVKEGVIPKEYLWQIVMYFYVIDTLESLLFFSYRPENIEIPEFRLEIKREDLEIELAAADEQLTKLHGILANN